MIPLLQYPVAGVTVQLISENENKILKKCVFITYITPAKSSFDVLTLLAMFQVRYWSE